MSRTITFHFLLIIACLLANLGIARSQPLTWERLHSPIQPSVTTFILSDEDSVLYTWGTAHAGVHLRSGVIDPTEGYFLSGSPDWRAPNGSFTIGDTMFAASLQGPVKVKPGNSPHVRPVDSSFMIPVYSLIHNAQNVFYAGGIGNVYRSPKQAGDWTTVGAGLPNDTITVIFASGDTLMAGTMESGCYQYNSVSGVWSRVPGVHGYLVRSILRQGSRLLIGTRDDGCYALEDASGWHLSNNGLTLQNTNQLIEARTGIVYAATDEGVFQWPPNATSWQLIDLPARDVQRLLATPEGDYYSWTDDGHIFRSADHGQNWNNISVPMRFEAYTYMTEPTPGELVVGTAYGWYFRSSDGGATWSRRGDTPQMHLMTDAVYKISPTTFIGATTSYGLIISTNEGLTWHMDSTAPEASMVTGIDSTILFSLGAYLYRSTTKGRSWERMVDVNAHCNSIVCLDKQNIYVSSDSGIFSSHNGGDSWQRTDISQRRLWGLPLTSFGNQIYAYSQREFDTTNDNGLTWVKAFTPPTNPRCLILQNDYFLISDGTNFFRSTDRGATWTPSARAIAFTNSLTVGIDIDSKGTLYANTFESMFRSTDKGLSWQQVPLDYYERLQPIGIFTSYSGLCETQNGTLLFAMSNNNMFRSTDRGATWARRDTTWDSGPYVRNLFAASNGHIYALKSAGFSDDSILVSNDDGISWHGIPQPHDTYGTFGDKFLREDHQHNLYRVGDGLHRLVNDTGWGLIFDYNTIRAVDIAFDSSNGMEIISTDDYNNYLYTSKDLKQITKQPFVFDQGGSNMNIEVDRTGDLFAFTSFSLIRLPHNASVWDTIHYPPFDEYGITKLIVAPDQHILAVTNGGGIFRSVSISGNSVPLERPKEALSVWCSPNPCNARTSIHISSTTAERATFELLDYRGATLRKLTGISSEKDAELDLAGLSDGCYIGRLTRADGSVSMTKLVVLH